MNDTKPTGPPQPPRAAPPPPAAAPAAQAAKDGPQKDLSWQITLSRPLETHEGPRPVLRLKDPPGAMVIRHGLPWHQKVRPDATGGVEWIDVEFDGPKMGAYLEAMTGVDQMTLESMSARDLSACFTAIFQMLQPAGN